MTELKLARSELIIGGQKSGKSRRGEDLAAAWLHDSPAHKAVLIATAQAYDDEMRQRIARHQHERALRVPGLRTLEASKDLHTVLQQAGGAETLRVIDCLTLWLTGLLMPMETESQAPGAFEDSEQAIDRLLVAIEASPGPVVLVGNEIGLGVIPMGREVRAFVDALGILNQRVAARCERVVLMAAGLPLYLKGSP